MPNATDIIQQIEALPNGKSYVCVAAPQELARIMDPDEHLHAVVDGYDGKEEESGLLFATEKRVIYIHTGVLWGVHVKSFYYDNISSIQYSSGPYHGNIVIHLDNLTVMFKTVPGEDEAEFVKTIHHLMSSLRSPASPSSDFMDQLERLSELHSSGALTDEEFTSAKQKLLTSS